MSRGNQTGDTWVIDSILMFVSVVGIEKALDLNSS